ncbi:hypothetical protein [Carnobacterium pleistocenium]|uniref:hypothetical protein n=1 Tax=Carnobacterium pleistocenium TaxID=181073 RepID=UPI00054D44A1|nr:hypothetical protein [Carnobacterium pleistocenium]
MAKHETKIKWRDLLDKTKAFPLGRIYEAGDEFPATKRKVSDERIEVLKQKEFIVEVEEESKIEIAEEVEQPKE